MAKSKAANAAHKAFRSTEHLPKYQPQAWSYYSPVSDYSKLTKPELAKIVNRAAKAANQRLRSLEKSGFSTTSHAYKYAKSQRPQEKPRFKERVTANMDQATLRHEFMQLREFLSMKTSTPTGVKAARVKGFETAKQKGFTGSAEQWAMNVQKYFAAVNEGLLSSDVAYQAITAGQTDLLDEQIKFWRNQQKAPTAGENLLDYLDRLERKGLL